MMNARHWLGLGCLLASCEPGDDIVARPAERGNSDAGSADSDGAAPSSDTGGAPRADAGAMECCDAGLASDFAEAGTRGPPACTAGGDSFLLLTKQPYLHRVFAEGGKLDPRGVPSCLPAGDITAAVDADGKLWAVPGDGVARVIDPNTLDCKQTELKLNPTAMAFVYHPELDQQQLYVLQGGVLLRIDPTSLVQTPLGELEPSRLAGSADGRLFAISDRTGGAIMVEAVDTNDAALGEGWKLGVPSSTPLSGAAMHASSLSLMFGADLYRAQLASDNPTPVAALFAQDPGIVAVAAPPCAFSSK